ncbi:2,3-bisphosphoglycerate-independent phosphoglycerate mutase [Seohaeicola nanhaiensis]|uniref:2,3-bisphosphoglycerate-independent phosphoglycerate mutase n=1 Tax=Seohaeicola nanhaiensis TaxID=1387282 RepID=A0ABV9KGG3_9RHOB
MSAPKPVVLCILDGWGLSDATAANAPYLAHTPTYDAIMQGPHATLVTHGPDVGLPRGQMGNSEVGHTNIGAGRVVAMDLGQIDLAIEDGSFFTNPRLVAFAEAIKASGGAAHLFGLASNGGVHGTMNHTIAAAEMLTRAGVPVLVHAITDGRDVVPGSATRYVAELEQRLPEGAKIVTVIGRYWALDRDNRWERIAKAYDAIVKGQGEYQTATAAEAMEGAVARGESDEFTAPTIIGDYAGARDGDGVFCLNFRSDRAREIMAAFGAPGFDSFDTGPRPKWAGLLGMSPYSDAHETFMTTAFPKSKIVNTLGAWVSKQGKRQFRLAETEKYPHVTFFLNGGQEVPEEGEDRHMPPSPKVATYDLKPEMSAAEVTDKFVEAIEAGYDLIVTNYANPDMVGHTGSLAATIKACEAVDQGLARVVQALNKAGGVMIVTADHGNSELMIDPETGGPHTAHTTNLVPVALVGGPAGATLRNGRLADLAPTLLALMGLPKPPEMTGESLLA